MQRCDLVCHEEQEQQHPGLQGFGNPSTRPRLQLSLVNSRSSLLQQKKKKKKTFPQILPYVIHALVETTFWHYTDSSQLLHV